LAVKNAKETIKASKGTSYHFNHIFFMCSPWNACTAWVISFIKVMQQFKAMGSDVGFLFGAIWYF
jgi:hypothetical protein